MRVLFISGSFLPDRCGVADYLWHLVQELAACTDTEVAVLSSCPNPACCAHPVRHFKGRNIVSIKDAAKAVWAFRPDIVHIQYPASRAISRYIPLFVRRVLRTPVAQTWHEHYTECSQLRWSNVLGLDGVVYVREDLPQRLPTWLHRMVKHKATHVPNASTIPSIRMTNEQRSAIKNGICGGRRLVTFFGFANPNKGVDELFRIADPDRHHLLLICDLDQRTEYHRRLLSLAQSESWRGHVTMTGFLPPAEVGRLLAVSDAIVFPFPAGIGDWNTSVQAALASGSFVIGTSDNYTRLGYDNSRNLALAPCGDWQAIRAELLAGLGRRQEPDSSNGWSAIANAHRELYTRLQVGFR
jgi:glycosyltransferase involved in cell wall biosynthesis